MKKILAISILFLMAMSAFGQTISGSIESGLKVVNTSTGTTIQHFSWNNGGNGWGQLKVNATKDNTSADIYIRSTDSNTLAVPYMWVTQKYLKDALVVRVGKMDADMFATPYQGFTGIGGQGVQASYKLGKMLTVGGFVPLDNVAQDISSIQQFKVGGSANLGPVALTAAYANLTNPLITGSASATLGQFWLGIDAQNVSNVTTISPYVDFTTKNGKFNGTIDIWTDTADLVKNSETALWLNFYPVPEFRLLGRVIYVGADGSFKTREGFAWKVSKNTNFRAQLDSAWVASPTHTLNAFIVQSF